MHWTCEDSKVESNRFNQASEYYDTYRPSYPKGMIDRILEYANLGANGEILEVGAGSGKATELFVDRGLSVTCVEQGENLAQVGMDRFRETGLVDYKVGRFEEVPLEKNAYEMVLSAQAFHWVERPLGYAIIKRTLNDNGTGALMWNKYLDDGSEMSLAIKDICSKYGVLHLQSEEEIFTMCEDTLREIKSTNYFKDIELVSEPWEEQQSLEEFINFLKTGNGYIRLDKDAKEALFKELKIIFRNYGNEITRKFICTTFLFKKI